MNLPFGRNHAMKQLLGNSNNEFDELRGSLSRICKQLTTEKLTEEEIKELVKLSQEVLYQLNRKVMETTYGNQDNRLRSASAGN